MHLMDSAHMQWVDSLAHVSRRLAKYRYVSKFSGLLYRLFPPHGGISAESWTVINDYDETLKFKIDRSAYIGGTIYWYGMHSRRILQYLDRILCRDMVFADIGANQGEFTVFAAKRLVTGKVLAFEPEPATYRQLEENIHLNAFNNVESFNFALFDKESIGEIYAEARSVSNRRRNEGLFSLFDTRQGSKKLGTVRLRTLDGVFADRKFARLDVIKIDVEGAELMVLRGAESSLRRFKPAIVLEVSPELFSAAGYDVRTLAQFLGGLGYGFHRLDTRSRLVETPVELLTAQCDVVCVPLDGSRSMP